MALPKEVLIAVRTGKQVRYLASTSQSQWDIQRVNLSHGVRFRTENTGATTKESLMTTVGKKKAN